MPEAIIGSKFETQFGLTSEVLLHLMEMDSTFGHAPQDVESAVLMYHASETHCTELYLQLSVFFLGWY